MSQRPIHNIAYHIVWIPKYRAKILTGDFKVKITQYLFEKAEQLQVIIETYEIMPDHVHLFIRCKPTQCISDIVGQLKGYSSFKLREAYPKYRKYKHLWAQDIFAKVLDIYQRMS